MDVSDDIRLLINAMTKAGLAFRKRPQGPADRLDERKRQFGRSRIKGMLEAN